MEQLSSHQQIAEIPMPINKSSSFVGALHGYGHDDHVHAQHVNMSHNLHNHHLTIPSSSSPLSQQIIPLNTTNGTTNNHIEDDREVGEQRHYSNVSKKSMGMIKYRECQKNHAASLGGNATDGCGEFMPSGEEGSVEALTCCVCSCHRNFHRKEIEGEQHIIIPHQANNSSLFYPSTPHANFLSTGGKRVILGDALGQVNVVPFSSSVPINVAYQVVGGQSYSVPSSDHSDDHHGGGGVMMMRPHQGVKKRFRTKFSCQQKEKMFEFAEKVGWKIQRQEESVVQQFCTDIGVTRRVLKVWMHNNKHQFVNKNNSSQNI